MCLFSMILNEHFNNKFKVTQARNCFSNSEKTLFTSIPCHISNSTAYLNLNQTKQVNIQSIISELVARMVIQAKTSQNSAWITSKIKLLLFKTLTAWRYIQNLNDKQMWKQNNFTYLTITNGVWPDTPVCPSGSAGLSSYSFPFAFWIHLHLVSMQRFQNNPCHRACSPGKGRLGSLDGLLAACCLYSLDYLFCLL